MDLTPLLSDAAHEDHYIAARPSRRSIAPIWRKLPGLAVVRDGEDAERRLVLAIVEMHREAVAKALVVTVVVEDLAARRIGEDGWAAALRRAFRQPPEGVVEGLRHLGRKRRREPIERLRAVLDPVTHVP